MFERIFESIREHNIWKWLRHCPVCRQSFPPVEWLCKDCLKHLNSCYLKPQYIMRMQSSFRHLRLMDWTSENDFFMRALLMSLKGPRRSLFFKELAREFFMRIQYLPSLKRDQPFIFIPCPSRSFSKDHGFFWAKALGGQLQQSVHQALSHVSSRADQKRAKNLSLRGERKFLLTIDECQLKNKNLVFVDDVVTSGATAKAAYLALGQPDSFMVWSLFWRKKMHQSPVQC